MIQRIFAIRTACLFATPIPYICFRSVLFTIKYTVVVLARRNFVDGSTSNLLFLCCSWRRHCDRVLPRSSSIMHDPRYSNGTVIVVVTVHAVDSCCSYPWRLPSIEEATINATTASRSFSVFFNKDVPLALLCVSGSLILSETERACVVICSILFSFTTDCWRSEPAVASCSMWRVCYASCICGSTPYCNVRLRPPSMIHCLSARLLFGRRSFLETVDVNDEEGMARVRVHATLLQNASSEEAAVVKSLLSSSSSTPPTVCTTSSEPLLLLLIWSSINSSIFLSKRLLFTYSSLAG